jgi:hypothetical protein
VGRSAGCSSPLLKGAPAAPSGGPERQVPAPAQPSQPRGTGRALRGRRVEPGCALQLLAGGPSLANQLVHDYLVQPRQRGLASATINRLLFALRSLIRLARLFQLVSRPWTCPARSWSAIAIEG